MNEAIQTFRGPAPRCLCCGKPLRPQYKSETEKLFHGTGVKKVWLPRPEYDRAEDYPPPDDPTVDKQADKDHMGDIYWSARKRSWYRLEKYQKVTKRVFTGRFGSRSDNFFCQTECGYAYGKAVATRLYGSRAPT